MKIENLIGETFVDVKQIGENQIHFILESGLSFVMHHNQDCCESVTIEDINGDLSDLVGSPILQASEAVSNENPEGVIVDEYQDSFTYTFYKLATIKGYVTIRWYGESNGYYSESVDLTFFDSSGYNFYEYEYVGIDYMFKSEIQRIDFERITTKNKP